MKFYQYSEIENSYNVQIVEKFKNSCYVNERYAIQEKIHGSNVQCCYDKMSDSFIVGKRTSFISEDDNFYNADKILPKYYSKIKDIFIQLKQEIPNINQLIVYGELYGGFYPHQDVDCVATAKQIQKGVAYSPDNHWIAFDIGYTTTSEDVRKYIPVKQFYNLCNSVSLPSVPLLKVTDSLQDALDFKNDDESIIYEMFNLPKIEDNIMEGIVIKPYDRVIYIGNSRLILKSKNDKFIEKSKSKNTNVQQTKNLTKDIIEKISEYLNENRLNNVVSKFGDITEHDIGKVSGLFANDALNDFYKDNNTKTYTKADRKMLQKSATKLALEIIKNKIKSEK